MSLPQDYPDEGIYWHVNFDRFHQYMLEQVLQLIYRHCIDNVLFPSAYFSCYILTFPILCDSYQVLGYSRIYPQPPYGRHRIGYLKILGFRRMTVAVFAGFQTLLIVNLGNSRILQYFEWFSWNSSQNSQNLGGIHGFPVMLAKHFLQDFQCRPVKGPIWNSSEDDRKNCKNVWLTSCFSDKIQLPNLCAKCLLFTILPKR